MSRAYIVTRNGGTVTKAPINDNKIPIYDNETELDADLANIPDNTIVATKGGHDDVIDQMKEYIRKQNVLSEVEVIYTWADTRLSNYFPYVCPYDGFLYFGIETSYNRSITINGIEIFSTSSSGNRYGYSIYVSKGDIFSIQIRSPTDSCFSMFSARFYKERDYKGR